LQGIALVRARLPRAEDFGELFELFHDRVVDVPGLWSSSKDREHELLLLLVTTIARRVRPGFVPLCQSVHEVGDTGFLHGAVTGTTGLACYFYDEHAGIGMVAVCNPLDLGDRTHYVRMRPVLPEPPGERMPN